jgi:hypothetical protein
MKKAILFFCLSLLLCLTGCAGVLPGKSVPMDEVTILIEDGYRVAVSKNPLPATPGMKIYLSAEKTSGIDPLIVAEMKTGLIERGYTIVDNVTEADYVFSTSSGTVMRQKPLSADLTVADGIWLGVKASSSVIPIVGTVVGGAAAIFSLTSDFIKDTKDTPLYGSIGFAFYEIPGRKAVVRRPTVKVAHKQIGKSQATDLIVKTMAGYYLGEILGERADIGSNPREGSLSVN